MRSCYNFQHLCDYFQSSPHWLTFVEPIAVCRASGFLKGSSLALEPVLPVESVVCRTGHCSAEIITVCKACCHL